MEIYFPQIAERDEQLQNLLEEKARIEEAWIEPWLVVDLINARIQQLQDHPELNLDDE